MLSCLQTTQIVNPTYSAPGATTYQTEEDAEVVENLAKRYIEDSRTIIL